MIRLESKGRPPLRDGGFGESVAVSSRYVVVGEPFADEGASDAGAAQVSDAVTGRVLRRIKAAGEPNGQFGTDVAVSGDFALIGAPGENTSLGAAHLVDLRTGRRLRSYTPSGSGLGADSFGSAVALGNDRVVVGAPFHNNGRGAVYVFDRETGSQLQRLAPLTGGDGDYFGSSLALSGRLLLAGALNHNNQRGAAYVFDLLRTPAATTEVFKITAADGADGDEFGARVALDGVNALVGAWGHNGGRGAAYLFNLAASPSPALVRKLSVPGANAGDAFGGAVALDGQQAVVGAYGRDNERGAAYVFHLRDGEILATLQAADGSTMDHFGAAAAFHGGTLVIGARQAGASLSERQGYAYLLPQVARPLPLVLVAQRGTGTPGVAGAVHAALGEAFVTGDGYALYSGGLAGGGSSLGVWSHDSGGVQRLRLLRGVTLGSDAGGITPGARIARVEQIVSADSQLAWMKVTLTGPGVNRDNSSAWFISQSLSRAQRYFRTGEGYFTPGGGGGEIFSAVPDLGHSLTHTALSYRFKHGVAGVDATNDTGVLGMTNGGPPNDMIPREGLSLPGGELLSESFGRVSVARAATFYGFGAHVLPAGGGAPLRKLFLRMIGGSSPAEVAREGQIAPNLGGFERFSAFVGETQAANGFLIHRATLRPDPGLGVGSTNNEGLWHQTRGIVMRKGGEVVPGEAGVVFSRILGFWPCGPDRVLVHAIAKGAGIKASNDGGLWLWDYDGGAYTLQTLLREGDTLPHPDAPRVGVIQRVDADAESGRYTVLVSLTGSAGANQALLTGEASAGNTGLLKALRLPAPRLRKGTPMLGVLSGSARVTALALAGSTDKTGAGGKGRAQVINATGQIMTRVSFTSGAQAFLTGRP